MTEASASVGLLLATALHDQPSQKFQRASFVDGVTMIRAAYLHSFH